MEEAFDAIREKFFELEDPDTVHPTLRNFRMAIASIEYPRNKYNVLVQQVVGDIYDDPSYSNLVFRVIFKHGIPLDTMDERCILYMSQVLEQLFANRGSMRLALKSLIDSFPRLEWEVQNAIRTELFGLEAFKIDDEDAHIGRLDAYTESSSYVINSFIRDHTQFGHAETKLRWDALPTTYTGPNFDYLNWNVGFVHPFQQIQWIIALSVPLTSPTHVFRWGNGPERSEMESLQIGDSMTLAGYTSTTLIPWLTFQFSSPAYIRDHDSLIFTDWNGLSSQLIKPPFGHSGEGKIVHFNIDPALDTPYGMMINVPSKTRCLYIESGQAEILLAHACTIQLTKRFMMQGGENFENRDIPFFVFDLIDDGIHFYDQ